MIGASGAKRPGRRNILPGLGGHHAGLFEQRG